MAPGARVIAFALSLVCLYRETAAQTWCGKNYIADSPPAGGQFPIPAVSSKPLLAFRYAPVIKPYLPEDASRPAAFLIDAPLTFSEVVGAAPIDLPTFGPKGALLVTVKVTGKTLNKGLVGLNDTKVELPFSLKGLKPQSTAFDVECSATYLALLKRPQTFTATTKLSYLPDSPHGRTVTKIDLRTACPEEVGIYLMYDMRWTYMNNTAVTEEVNRIKNSPALLLWYTGDEPDGTSDPLNATTTAYDLIYSLDGYHPVSLVLNCQDYYWTECTAGSDIVMQDAYTMGINATFSTVWGTPCTPDYGNCGCDNCNGEFEDISTRIDQFAERRFVQGRERTKADWTVPQGFGGGSYWSRVPTGKEFIVQSVLAINHGALSVVSWNAPTTADVTAGAALLSRSLETMKDVILHPHASFTHAVVDRVDVRPWTVGTRTLVLATNLNYAQAKVDLSRIPEVARALAVKARLRSRLTLDSGARLEGHVVTLESVGTGGFVLG
ncbi:hypothetical protein C8Q76DRAFT_755941 [Earliella scabrosa]|nr:hypothetical protein C8Q76DRAFT_755941 [Earliella scabrosa]